MDADAGEKATRQERREQRLLAARERMRKSGAGLAVLYRNAVLKRLAARSKRQG